MNLHNYFFNVALVLVLLFGCENKSEQGKGNTQVENEQIEKTVFVPNPQIVPEQKVETLEINATAPNFNLPGVDGQFYSLENFSDAQVLVIIFTCNHCPTAQAYEQRIIDIVSDYQDKSVAVVAISPNSIKGLLLEELGYSDLGDSYEEMQIRAKERKFNFAYLYDGDTQQTSIKYGPTATPHAFVFDKERKLKYTGRLDNSEKPGSANADDLRDAIDAILAGNEITNPVTKTFGCSIKWGWKVSWTNKVNEDWAKAPAELQEIDIDGINQLMANDSDKLRLINIWATWCGPCVIEYPEFVEIHRMYKDRDFTFISLSADKLESKDKALKFLKGKQSALQNYIYSGEDTYQLIDAVDPDWDGALPYTVLLEPGGNIVYKKMGPIEPHELKSIIVDHPMIGRYY